MSSSGADNLVESKARASAHAFLCSLGSEAYRLAAELRVSGDTGAWQWRMEQLARDLVLAAEELGLELDDVRKDRAARVEERRVTIKARRALREADRAENLALSRKALKPMAVRSGAHASAANRVRVGSSPRKEIRS